MTQTTEPVANAALLAELGHELRTPLTAILGYAEAMAEEAFGPVDRRYVDGARAIGEAGRHMLGLVDTMTTLAHVEQGRWSRPAERFELGAAVEQAAQLVALMARAAGVELIGPPPGDPVDVVAERQAIVQILINLLTNALKATPPGGAVSVEFAALGPDARLTVADTGEGMGEAKPGLGLALACAFCERHGGSLVIENAPGGGTRATVRLPILAEP